MRVDVEVVVRFSVEVKDQADADQLAENTGNGVWVEGLAQHLDQGADVEVLVGEAYSDDDPAYVEYVAAKVAGELDE